MKILVTGGAGFIGSEFVRQFHKNYKISVIDNLSYSGNLGKIHCFKHKFIQGDISKLESLDQDLIINFAAQTHVDRSIKDNHAFIQSNIIGVQVLIDLCLKHKVKLIHISTDEVYGDSERGFFTEESPLRPNNPYSATKASAEHLIRAAVRTHGLNAIIIRPTNNYGLWQYPEKFIPVIITKALKNERIPVYGQGKQVREWLHVSDCVKAIQKILEKGVDGEIYNIGSGFEQDNLTTVKTVLRLMNKPESLIEFVPDRPGHDFRYSVDFRKLEELGWEPKISFEEGIKHTIEFYKNI